MTGRAQGSGPNQSGLAEDHAQAWIASGRAGESLEDPEAYRAFVKALYAKVEARMANQLDVATQTELAELGRLLMIMPRKAVDEHRATFETAFDLLAAGSPNILVIRSLRLTLDMAEQRNSSPLVRLVLHVCGDTPLAAVLAALASVFVLSFVVIAAMDQGHRWLSNFYAIGGLPIGQVMLLLHAAFVGSIVSVIVRIRDFLESNAFGPLWVFISVLTKPIVAVAFAVLAYSVLKAGLVSSAGMDLDGPQGPYVAWALGFLSGFSERFAQDFVIGAGTEPGEPSSPERRSSAPRPQDR